MGRRRRRESDEIGEFLGRMLRAMTRRAAAGDLGALSVLVKLRDQVDATINDAGAALHATGLSYATLGGELGISRQAARMRFLDDHAATSNVSDSTP